MARQYGNEENSATVKRFHFKLVHLYKEQTLGIGAYGKVCRAKCDDLICAAKVIHETLFEPGVQYQIAPQREHRLPIRRFEQECEFLNTLRHPNIVQYLGIHRDPDTGTPLLLMELMDESLTHFLDRSLNPIPYHKQVNFCHDITLALSFLHSNDIIHRDLSSNNVLLISNVRAKVTDFGMAQLSPTEAQFTFTVCPGTDVYMPPEAVDDNPAYSQKLDCFSFGVLIIQILTRHFPKPGNRRENVTVDHPRFHGRPVQVNVPEVNRRQEHISEIDPNHPLLTISLDCLRDNAEERPSAQQLCNRLEALKRVEDYSQSIERTQEKRNIEYNIRTTESVTHAESLPQELSQIQGLQQIISSQVSRLREKDEIIATEQFKMQQIRQEKAETIQQLRRQLTEKDELIKEKEKEVGQIKAHLEVSEEVVAQFQKRVHELEQLLIKKEKSSANQQSYLPGPSCDFQTVTQTNISLTWRMGDRAPCVLSRGSDAIVSGGTMYCGHFRLPKVFSHHATEVGWFQVRDCPIRYFSIANVNGLLTTVGGGSDTTFAFGLPTFGGSYTNKLFSLVVNKGDTGRWKELLPPMPTKRRGAVALCTGTYLIVAGGEGEEGVSLATVEVLNTDTLQWLTAAELPEPRSMASATIVDENIYIVGGQVTEGRETNSVFVCSMTSLINSCNSSQSRASNPFTNVWNRIACPPVVLSTCVSLCSRLLTVGGKTLSNERTSAIHMYNPTTDSWEVISQMPTARYLCLAAAPTDNHLLVVGGMTGGGTPTDSVEIAIVQ